MDRVGIPEPLLNHQNPGDTAAGTAANQQQQQMLTTMAAQTGVNVQDPEAMKRFFEEFAPVIDLFRQFSPNGDVKALGAMMMDKVKQDHETKMKTFREQIDKLKSSGALGENPDETAKYLEDAPPQVVAAFASATSNLNEQISRLDLDRRLMEQTLATERKQTEQLKEKLSFQQGLGMASHAERFNYATKAAQPVAQQQQQPQLQLQQQQSAVRSTQPMLNYGYQPVSAGVVYAPPTRSVFDNFDESAPRSAVSTLDSILSSNAISYDKIEFMGDDVPFMKQQAK